MTEHDSGERFMEPISFDWNTKLRLIWSVAGGQQIFYKQEATDKNNQFNGQITQHEIWCSFSHSNTRIGKKLKLKKNLKIHINYDNN